MPAGQAIRERMIRENRRALGFVGRSTALAGGVNRLRDAVRFGMSGLATEEYADSFIRITSVSNSDEGLVAKVLRITQDGDIFFSPSAGAAIVSGTTYELWRLGIRPDDVDASRDRCLTEKCSMWRYKPLSILPDVEDWRTAAYDATLGGVTLAAAAAQTLDFPDEIAEESMLVTNSGATGILSSRSLYTQPGRTYRVYGRVSARAQTASIRVRRITAPAADITLTGLSTFTFRGWQWFEVTFTVPDGCGEFQIWLGGADAACISDWMLVGIINTDETLFSLQSRVLGRHDVSNIREVHIAGVGAVGNQRPSAYEIDGVQRIPAGDGLALLFSTAPGHHPVYYNERHRYAALQTDYLAASDRITGDAATTDCPLAYIEAATLVELLKPLGSDLPSSVAALLLAATEELRTWERRVGPDPFIVHERDNPDEGGVPYMRL